MTYSLRRRGQAGSLAEPLQPCQPLAEPCHAAKKPRSGSPALTGLEAATAGAGPAHRDPALLESSASKLARAPSKFVPLCSLRPPILPLVLADGAPLEASSHRPDHCCPNRSRLAPLRLSRARVFSSFKTRGSRSSSTASRHSRLEAAVVGHGRSRPTLQTFAPPPCGRSAARAARSPPANASTSRSLAPAGLSLVPPARSPRARRPLNPVPTRAPLRHAPAGSVEFVACHGPLPSSEWVRRAPEHCVSGAALPYRTTYAWEIRAPISFTRPVPYSHKPGCVIWACAD